MRTPNQTNDYMEDGKLYVNACIECGTEFYGHKLRRICKGCNSKYSEYNATNGTSEKCPQLCEAEIAEEPMIKEDNVPNEFYYGGSVENRRRAYEMIVIANEYRKCYDILTLLSEGKYDEAVNMVSHPGQKKAMQDTVENIKAANGKEEPIDVVQYLYDGIKPRYIRTMIHEREPQFCPSHSERMFLDAWDKAERQRDEINKCIEEKRYREAIKLADNPEQKKVIKSMIKNSKEAESLRKRIAKLEGEKSLLLKKRLQALSKKIERYMYNGKDLPNYRKAKQEEGNKCCLYCDHTLPIVDEFLKTGWVLYVSCSKVKGKRTMVKAAYKCDHHKQEEEGLKRFEKMRELEGDADEGTDEGTGSQQDPTQ